MPRNMEDIIFPINEEPETLRDFNRYSRDSVWVIHKNTIALPAGTRRGKCRTPEATKNIQARYWETGIPLGLELELEMDGYGECYGDDCCEECYDGYCCGCNSERALNSDEVTNILRKSRLHVYEQMRNFALRKGRDTYRWVSPIVAKGDGSLENGVEFNYQPMTVDAFKPLADIVEEERGGLFGYRGNSGIHIHVPKSAFTDAELYLWMILWDTFQQYVDNKGRTFLSIIAQREPNSWCEYTRPIYGDVEDAQSSNFVKCIKNDRKSRAPRYSALNLNGHGTTMEIRAFNSNTYANRLIKNMAFVDATWRYVHLLKDYLDEGRYKQALQFATDVHGFVSYCKNPLRKGYNWELAEFLDDRWNDSKSMFEQNIVYDLQSLPNLIQLNEEDNGGTQE
tara:strand:+ start:2918 stop:4105 length:1188 start_codon:yes stop_codon:yes gene_type:complete